MKRKFTNFKALFTIAILVLGVNSANSQVKYYEDFEGGLIPSDFTLIDGDNDGKLMEVIDGVGYGNDGFALISRSWTSTGGARNPNDYAFLPKLDLRTYSPGTKVYLTYYVMNFEDTFEDSYTVYASTDTSKVDTNSLFEIKSISTPVAQVWEKVEIDLSSYVNARDSNFFIAFRHHNSYDKNFIIFDNIMVSTPIDYDVSFVNATVGEYGVIPQFFGISQVPASVSVANNGLDKATGVKVDFDYGVYSTTFTSEKTGTFDYVTDILAGESRTFRGMVDVGFPLLNNLNVVSFEVGLNETDMITQNNLSSFYYAITMSENFYSRVEPGTVSPSAFYNIDFLRNDDNAFGNHVPTGESIDTLFWANSYEFYGTTSIDSVKVKVAPQSSGQTVWVEVYDLDLATNTIGLPINMLAKSEEVVVSSDLVGNTVKEIGFTFADKVNLPKGKYLFSIVELGTDSTTAAGLIGYNASNVQTETNGVSFMNFSADNSRLGWLDNDQIFAGKFIWAIDLVVSEATGISSQIDGSNISLYPNPTNGKVNVNFENDEFKPSTVNVLDITGRTLKSFNSISNKKSFTMDLNNLENGIYFIQLIDGEKSVSKKLVLKK